jgi:hypothetical protein
VDLDFRGELWEWRGPAPYHFITVPEEGCVALAAVAPGVSYGWGMIPVSARIGRTCWTTSLFPKDGSYVVPIRAAVRRSEDLEVGQQVVLSLHVDV